jgi:hypothetical protein
MRLRHLCAGLALLALTVLSGCYCGRSCGYPAYYPGRCCPPAVSGFAGPPACPCNGNGPAGVQAFSGGPPVVATPYHP